MSDFWQQNIQLATDLRRQLHRHPELGWHEHNTAQTIRRLLSEADIEWRECAETGTVAMINASGKGKHIALRGDIDALPIEEQSGQDWQSTQSGRMHACGHDGHTATLLATARWLKQHETSLAGPVSLLFQPAEEGGHGAREMIAAGALKGVDEIYGWHNWPAIPFGKMVCPDEIVMSGNGSFRITVTGKGGHASQPELCQDPVLAASAIVIALQQIVSRRLQPQKAVVVSVTSFDAVSAVNVIPQKAVLEGGIRVPDTVARKTVNQLIRDISESTAQSYGCQCEVEIFPRYEATINHPQQAQFVREQWRLLKGEHAFDNSLAVPIMGSEDFSYYLQQIPGAFALIGGQDDDPAHKYTCHSPHYDFNDRLIAEVVSLFSRLVGAPLPKERV